MTVYLCVWCPHKGVPLEQLHEGYLSLKQSKPHPNAAARTKTKWQMAELGPLGSLLCCEPILRESITMIQYVHKAS